MQINIWTEVGLIWLITALVQLIWYQRHWDWSFRCLLVGACFAVQLALLTHIVMQNLDSVSKKSLKDDHGQGSIPESRQGTHAPDQHQL